MYHWCTFLETLEICMKRLDSSTTCQNKFLYCLTAKSRAREVTSRPKRSRFCYIFLVQSLVWKYCLKLEGCLHNFFLIGPHSAAAEPNSTPKIVWQNRRHFCRNVRILRMPLNPRNHRCRYAHHSWSLVYCYVDTVSWEHCPARTASLLRTVEHGPGVWHMTPGLANLPPVHPGQLWGT